MLILNVLFIDILLNFLLPNSVKQYSQKNIFQFFNGYVKAGSTAAHCAITRLAVQSSPPPVIMSK